VAVRSASTSAEKSIRMNNSRCVNSNAGKRGMGGGFEADRCKWLADCCINGSAVGFFSLKSIKHPGVSPAVLRPEW